MSEQWYCPNCGILHEDVVDPVRCPAGLEEEEYFECRECGEVIDQNIPPFVCEMQSRIKALEAVAEAAIAFKNLGDYAAAERHQRIKAALTEALHAAGYTGEGE